MSTSVSDKEILPPKHRLSIVAFENTQCSSRDQRCFVACEISNISFRIYNRTSVPFGVLQTGTKHEWGWRETLWSNPYYCQSVCDSLHVWDIVTIITFQQSNHFLPKKQSMLYTQMLNLMKGVSQLQFDGFVLIVILLVWYGLTYPNQNTNHR